ncbi:hypothetical protein B0J12DRAFT_304973 [Macrophomina phaseolina]|uniref:Uncharacterized protein n=1 Tax=Macrophomina phaseolina TaxID=35725 RepID=A0ABQ8FXB9_9PEZI|nr:hypothetical protein B0J12DRAFT_304973 [Macrophomina phaseolina]
MTFRSSAGLKLNKRPPFVGFSTCACAYARPRTRTRDGVANGRMLREPEKRHGNRNQQRQRKEAGRCGAGSKGCRGKAAGQREREPHEIRWLAGGGPDFYSLFLFSLRGGCPHVLRRRPAASTCVEARRGAGRGGLTWPAAGALRGRSSGSPGAMIGVGVRCSRDRSRDRAWCMC